MTPTVRDALHYYLSAYARRMVVDISRQHVCCGWLEKGLGHYGLGKKAGRQHPLTVRQVNAYIHDRRTGKIGTSAAKDSTIRRELTVLKAALRRYARDHLLNEDHIVPRIDMPADSPPKDLWLTREEVDAAIDMARECMTIHDPATPLYRAGQFVLIALATAARRKSIETLTWKQVSFQAASETGSGLFRFDLDGKKKTKKRRVAVPIATWLMPYLRRMRRENPGEYVLGNATEIAHGVDRFFRTLATRTGNDRYNHVTAHTLRHTAATLAIRAGVPIFDVAKMLGDSVATTEKVYAHHVPGHLENAVNWR